MYQYLHENFEFGSSRKPHTRQNKRSQAGAQSTITTYTANDTTSSKNIVKKCEKMWSHTLFLHCHPDYNLNCAKNYDIKELALYFIDTLLPER